VARGKARQRTSSPNILPVPHQPQPPPPTPAVPELETAITAYRDALADLPQEPSDTAAARVRRALVARSQLAEVMSAAGASLQGDALARVLSLDEQLKASAPVLEALLGSTVLVGWRETLRPPEDAWWWSLDVRAAAFQEEHELGWMLLGGLLVTAAFSLSAEISQRFLSGSPDFLGVFSSLSQAALALLAGSSFTRVGGRWMERLFSRWGVRPRHRPLWKVGVALALFGAVLALRLSLPAIASLYERRGQVLLGRGMGGHEGQKRDYHLAVAYEEIHDYEQAIPEYEQALREYEGAGVTGLLPQLYNNLARLYLRSGKPESALPLLKEAFRKQEKGLGDSNFAYAIHKNRGWARLALGLPLMAQHDLLDALKLNGESTAAHCLLAQALEAEHPDQAYGHWETCLSSYEAGGEPVELQWIETAREKLEK
jgi:tetratricopeptide (TPR) repeat protein